MSPDDFFRNLVSVGGYFHPFIDRNARFGVTIEDGRGMGPCMIQPRSCSSTTQPIDLALNLCFEVDGQAVPINAGRREHLPWRLREEAVIPCDGGSIRVELSLVYLNSGALLCHYRFTNIHNAPTRFQPSWLGAAPGDRWPPSKTSLRCFGMETPPLRAHQAAWNAHSLTISQTDRSSQLPCPEARISWPDRLGLRTTAGTGAVWNLPETTSDAGNTGEVQRPVQWRIRASPIVLAAGESFEYPFLIEMRVHLPGTRSAPWSGASPEIDAENAAADSQRDFLARIGWNGQPVRSPAERRAWRARWALLRTGYQGDGHGELGTLTASTCVPSSSGFTRIFFWDSLFTGVALSRFNASFARDAMLAPFVRQDPETGFCPEHVFDRPLAARDAIGEAQAPVASWAVERHLALHPDDTGFLAAIYPKLVINHRHWEERGDRDRDGLAEWTWAGQTADDSPLYDEFALGRDRDFHGWLPPVASVALNSFLFHDAMTLSRLATRMGDHAGSTAWTARAGRIQEALMRVCYVPSERRFWDYNHATRRHRRVKTFYMFWPIWAGMEIPRETRDELIDQVLLDPRQFFGDVPFPSVAYDEPTYNPAGYWRGKAWPHISYWLIEMLRAQGRHEQAAEARRRVLAAWLKDPYHAENMNTNGDLTDPSGSAEYNWGCALVSLLLEERKTAP